LRISRISAIKIPAGSTEAGSSAEQAKGREKQQETHECNLRAERQFFYLNQT
jgi:hypothetical protein